MSALGPPIYVGLKADEARRLADAMRAEAWLRQLPPASAYELVRCEADGARFIVWGSGKLSYQGARAREVLEELVRGAGIAGEEGPAEAGSDEAGKGEWLGPLVVAAVLVEPERRLALRLDGVRDSKELGPEVRTRLAERIRQHAQAWNVVSVGPERFNGLWAEMHARGETLNDLLWWAHRTALEPVLRGQGAVRVVLDEFDRTRRAEREFARILPPGAEVEQRPRAEDALSVAAASVLARAERDRQVEELRRRFGLPEELSAEQARAHPQARAFAKVAYLENWGG